MPSKGVDMIEARRKAALVKMGKGVERAGQSTRAVGMSQFSGGKTLKKNPENDLTTSHYTGEELEKLGLLMTERKKLVKKIRRVTTLMRQKMLKNASINGNWYKLFKSYDRDNSGNISFAELAYVVYKELDISKLEMSLKELRSVWGVVDINGDNTVTVEEFASFMRRMEANKIDHVILDTVDKQLVEGRGKQPPPSPTKSVQGGASVLTRATSPPIGRTGRHLAALGPSEEPQAVSTWLRQYRRIADYSSISQTRSFYMGNPPEENATIANMVPRLEYNLKARQLQRIKFGEVLSTGGARYPLMEHKRDADRLYEVHGKPLYELEALEAVATSPRGTAPIDAFDQDAHWSQRLAMVPTHAMLAKQATKLADLKHKFKIKT